jgi:hypothetical protein
VYSPQPVQTKQAYPIVRSYLSELLGCPPQLDGFKALAGFFILDEIPVADVGLGET